MALYFEEQEKYSADSLLRAISAYCDCQKFLHPCFDSSSSQVVQTNNTFVKLYQLFCTFASVIGALRSPKGFKIHSPRRQPGEEKSKKASSLKGLNLEPSLLPN